MIQELSTLPSLDAVVSAPSDNDQLAKQRADEVRSIMESALISVNSVFPARQGTVAIGDIPFFELGDIHAIKAKQKQGKSTALQIIVAAALGGKRFRLAQAPLITEEDTPFTLFEPTIVYFDTEQKAQDVQDAYLRTLNLAGLPQQDIFHRLKFFSLRSCMQNDLLPSIEQYIRLTSPQLVIIDGIVDLAPAFNDEEKSQQIIKQLSLLASECNCAIVCVLHTNKDKEDNNMRGHLGTILAQKAGNVLECKKEGHIFRVINADSRHKEVPTWSFMYNEQDELIDADVALQEMLEEKKVEKQAKKEEDKRMLYQERVNKATTLLAGSAAMSPAEFKKQLELVLDLGTTTIKGLYNQFIEDGFISVVNGIVRLGNPADVLSPTNQQPRLFTD